MIDLKIDWCRKLGKLPTRDCEILVRHEPGEAYGKEIEGITHSVPYDLMVDNFGYILAMMHAPSGGSLNGIKDQTGTVQACCVQHQATNEELFLQGNGLKQFGSGTNAPTFGDIKIQTALITAPESGAVAITSFGYTPGTGVVTIVVTSGAFGAQETVGESVYYNSAFLNLSAVTFSAIISRYVYSAPLTVPIGKAITATTLINI